MISDPIADFLIRIKNAATARHLKVSVPFSNLKHEIAKVLITEGYLVSAVKKGRKVKKTLEMVIAYKQSRPILTGLERVSKSSRRVYRGAKDLRPVKQGFGQLVVSTPQGVLTGSAARRAGVGGEVLFKIW